MDKLERGSKDILKEILFSEKDIHDRLQELGRQITEEYRDKNLYAIVIMHGGLFFFADLTRCIDIPLRIASVNVSSYHGGSNSSNLEFIENLSLDNIDGSDILLLDDILDSGKTLSTIKDQIYKMGTPNSIKCCVLLNKITKRVIDIEPDYYGFEIEDKFVVGYGLDYKKRFRNLPFIGVLKNDLL